MTDNFLTIESYLLDLPETTPKGNAADRYYAIELMRRGKDNPDMPAANYHFKNYYVFSLEHFRKIEQEVKILCDVLRLRAYISVNYKSIEQVTKDCAVEYSRRVAVGDYKKTFSIFESCSGKYAAHGDNRFVIDIDDIRSLPTDEQSAILESYRDIIERCRNDKFEKKTIAIIPTRTGYHFVTHAFDRMQFNKLINEAGLAVPDIKANHLTLLYENL